MNTLPAVPFRPLGLILNVIEGCGFTLGHIYDDLVFTEENTIVLKMEDNPEDISLYINQDCESAAASDMEATLCIAARDEGLNFIKRGRYSLRQSGDDSFQIFFTSAEESV